MLLPLLLTTLWIPVLAAPAGPIKFQVMTCTSAPVRVCTHDRPGGPVRQQRFAREGWPTRGVCHGPAGHRCHVGLGFKDRSSCAAAPATIRVGAKQWIRVQSVKGRLKVTTHAKAPTCPKEKR